MNYRINLGRIGEAEVLKIYENQGFILIAKNFEYRLKTPGRLGEIDLILFSTNKNLLVLVEVKARMSTKFGSALEQVSLKQLRNIYYAYQYFLSKKEYCKYNQSFVRMDIATVFQKQVEITENAYSFDKLF